MKRGGWWAALTLGLCLLMATVALSAAKKYEAPTEAGVLPPDAVATVSAPAQPHGKGPVRATGRPGPSAVSVSQLAVPDRLQIPHLGVQASVVAVRARGDGALAVPGDPGEVGWWIGGAAPGDPQGTVVLDGHVDTARSGAGALFGLADLAPGAQVVVTTSAGDTRYKVIARRVYVKAALPRQIFNPGGPPRLALVTCGGPFDTQTRHYADNVVVYATPLSR